MTHTNPIKSAEKHNFKTVLPHQQAIAISSAIALGFFYQLRAKKLQTHREHSSLRPRFKVTLPVCEIRDGVRGREIKRKKKSEREGECERGRLGERESRGKESDATLPEELGARALFSEETVQMCWPILTRPH